MRRRSWSDWLTAVLRTVIRGSGTALTGTRPGNWEAWLPYQLIQGTPPDGSPPSPAVTLL
ncbi:MAG TPA: hypothetical protein VMV92_23615 [Streptosporangiaceae bacterium]|nr:hypothetical protein [Streptosporangiaceae bacterium]